MAILKCKMCGGDLEFTEDTSTAQCEYCGSLQTVPKADDEKKLTLFARANRLRSACEFDKAAGVYEAIVAEFQAEAEGYWGLVLCKYGIEYVDDPATGKKIPTCHRSSFETVMDDSDLEQALENADSAARKVYREEAKHIEELRKGIIAVSANEAPYDIFICYKETDEKGERTLDSVLAQDVYDALTDKGYRVFFSRISLEDKLGLAYEPYIFAALHSAKVMLAFGTDYEYFNAVWVKNEWSRFLKLMAKNKEKHLIPCFKGIDAYDMPKEFARLQAQDMGKVGAIQDLLRGIEKLLPRTAPETVAETVVLSGSVDSKVASLLDRGNMALEDGDWVKADSFFEDVLNNDSKNAQAYLGKMLVQEKCRTMDAFIRKRKDATVGAQKLSLCLKPDQAHVEQMVEKYKLGIYLTPDSISSLYKFDLHYPSYLAERKMQQRAEEKLWQEHKLLTRVEQFATGVVADSYHREKKALFDVLADRVKMAQEAEDNAKATLLANYKEHICQADQKVEALYQEALQNQRNQYEKWKATAEKSSNLAELKNLHKVFEGLGDYQDSKELVALCASKIQALEVEKKAQDEEKERRREEEREKQRTAEAAHNKKVLIITSIVAAILAVLVILWVAVLDDVFSYNTAERMLNNGAYKDAAKRFEQLEDYKDSPEKVKLSKYKLGEYYLENEKYSEAVKVFTELGDYEDSSERAKQARYNIGCAFMQNEEYFDAYDVFTELGDFGESAAQLEKCAEKLYEYAMEKLETNDINVAKAIFEMLGDYKNSKDMLISIDLQPEVYSQLQAAMVTETDIDVDALYALIQTIPEGTKIYYNAKQFIEWIDLIKMYEPYYGAFRYVSGDRSVVEKIFTYSGEDPIDCDLFLTHTVSKSDSQEWTVSGTYRNSAGEYSGILVSFKTMVGSKAFKLTNKLSSFGEGVYTMFLNEDGNLVIMRIEGENTDQCVFEKITPES